ncbi:MAG: hypothetical protein IJN63_10455 [Clostridia bacterium]|nr:hypothetical protein [Clostridia bacterium]
MTKYTCCFFGHRNVLETEELKNKVYGIVEKLIVQEKIDTFLFGSRSNFNSLCLEAVTKIKSKYPHIKRIYVRAEYPTISDDYKAYLLESYDDTYYPEKILRAGKAVYVERNFEMIRNSRFCVVCCEHSESMSTKKSGTVIAVNYAEKLKKEIIRISLDL